jgi:lysophospholipase L1-like esterase
MSAQYPDLTAMAERLVRYMHPDRSTPYLANAGPETLAAALGLSPAVYQVQVDAFDQQARAEADELMCAPEVADRLHRLPFQKGQTVLALGESDTADRLSWADVLGHVLKQWGDILVVNAAVSGQTSTEALGRWAATLRQAGRVDWVLCKLGTNDARRIAEGATLVRPEETRRNLSLLRALAGPTGARWVWLTPHPVDERRIAEAPGLRYTGSRWHNSDLVAVADGIRQRPETVVDLDPVFVPDECPGLLAADGLHPTPEGQRVILTALVDALSGAVPGRPGTA